MSSATKRETDRRLREMLRQDQVVRDMISHRAYEIYQDRGFEHGHDREDWLQAEDEILDELTGPSPGARLDLGPLDQMPQANPVIAHYDAPAVEPEWAAHQVSVPRGLGSHHAVPETARISPGSVVFPEPLKKKREKTLKAHSGRKHKKEAKVAGDEAKPIAQLKAKDKKSGHKSKETKKKKKDS